MTVGKLVLILALAFVVGLTFAECISQTLEEVTTPAKQED
jgi:Tfp pilus assembly protein PilO